MSAQQHPQGEGYAELGQSVEMQVLGDDDDDDSRSARLGDLRRQSSRGSQSGSPTPDDIEELRNHVVPVSSEQLGKLLGIPMLLGFIVVLYIMQFQHMDVHMQHDVHAGLRGLLFTAGDDDGLSFDNIRSKQAMFDWLDTSILPVLSGSTVDGGGKDELPKAMSTSGCPAAIPAAPVSFINGHSILFDGITITQTRRCQATHDIKFSAVRQSMPPMRCYSFVDEMDRLNTSAANEQERQYLSRCSLHKHKIYLPGLTRNVSAVNMAKHVLNAATDLQWADAATARIEVSFIVMAIEYGMTTQIVFTLDSLLGGQTKMKGSLKSVTAACMQRGTNWSCADLLFLVYFFVRLLEECNEVLGSIFGTTLCWQRCSAVRKCRFRNDSAKYDSSLNTDYTSFLPHGLRRGLFWWIPFCSGGKERAKTQQTAAKAFDAFVHNEVVKDGKPMATRQQIALAMKKLDDPITKVELSEMQDRYGELDHADTDERMVSREGFISFVTDRYRRSYLGDLWNIVEWVMIILQAQTLLLLEEMNAAHPHLEAAVNGPNGWRLDPNRWSGLMGPKNGDEDMKQIIGSLEDVISASDACRINLSIMMILSAILFLRRLQGYARMSLITQSLSFAGQELGHFLATFLGIVVMFALAGHFLYGAELAEFYSIQMSIQSTIEFVLGGGDYDRLARVNLVGTLVYYWTLIFIGAVIALNIALTVMMGGYEAAHNHLKDSPTLYETMRGVRDGIKSSVKSIVTCGKETASEPVAVVTPSLMQRLKAAANVARFAAPRGGDLPAPGTFEGQLAEIKTDISELTRNVSRLMDAQSKILREFDKLSSSGS